jgi:hypothetical protein
MTVPYAPKSGDEVYIIPTPATFGWAFSRSADPNNEAAARGYMLRAGYVFSLFADPLREGYYLLNVLPGTTANPTGIDETVWLNEMNYRWRIWAEDNDIDPDTDTNPADASAPVWVDAGSQLASLSAAAEVWGWTAL